jgi:pyruvate/2-oxoglutarate dehydrogenase complex dihydrolipoamide dehydrogenase (E3) component
MEAQGIKFYMKANIEKLVPAGTSPRSSESAADRLEDVRSLNSFAESNSSHVGSVQVKGQDPLPANLVIMGTGVAPATQFLKDSGFQLEKDGGIVVDEYLRVKGQDHIYAIGDIAHYTQYPDKFQRRVEHWNVAGNQVSGLCGCFLDNAMSLWSTADVA